MESFDFIVISREFSDTFFMLGFIFLNKSGFFIFSCVFSFFQGLIKESSLLVNPFKVFSHLKFGMIDNSLSLISGLCEGSSLEVFPSDVVDRWFSVLVFNLSEMLLGTVTHAVYYDDLKIIDIFILSTLFILSILK